MNLMLSWLRRAKTPALRPVSQVWAASIFILAPSLGSNLKLVDPCDSRLGGGDGESRHIDANCTGNIAVPRSSGAGQAPAGLDWG